MYIETSWGKALSWIFGGYASALTVHKITGIVMLSGFLIHIIYLILNIDWRHFPRSLLGPDFLLPQPRDIIGFFHHIAWLPGMTKPPRFDRWGYWEKFDYWSVFWGIVILGGTGLILFNTIISSRYIPGWELNVGLWIHRIESILAMAHVFIIQFIIGHLRRHFFPMDLAMFAGSVDLEKTRHERPAWVDRLEKNGTLQDALVQNAPVSLWVVSYVFGFAVMFCCFYRPVNGLATGREMLGRFMR